MHANVFLQNKKERGEKKSVITSLGIKWQMTSGSFPHLNLCITEAKTKLPSIRLTHVVWVQFSQINKPISMPAFSTDHNSTERDTTRRALWVFVPSIPYCPVMTSYYGNNKMSRSSVEPGAGSSLPHCHLSCKTNVKTSVWSVGREDSVQNWICLII